MSDGTQLDEPAFPIRGAASEHQHTGMTLRDYFAVKAMPEEMRAGRVRYELGDIDVQEWREAQEIIATYAYDMADAMLKARQPKAHT